MESFKEINKKEVCQNGYAITIEEGVIEDYISSVKDKPENKGLNLTDIERKWISNHASEYRDFFTANCQKIIELYKKDPKQAFEYIESAMENSENKDENGNGNNGDGNGKDIKDGDGNGK